MHDAPGSEELLRVDGLGFTHPGRVLLRDLSFGVRPGLTVVRGGDGRGKTTLLRLLAGERRPSAGRVLWLAGQPDLVDPTDPRDDPLTARQWLDRRRDSAPGWEAARCEALVDGFDLAPHRDKALFMLSTGTRRKVGLVAAFAGGSRLVLIDSPFAGLDRRSGARLAGLLREAAAHPARGWVIADHEVPEGIEPALLCGLVDLGD